MKLKTILAAAVLLGVSFDRLTTPAVAEVETPNEHVVKTITNKEAFNRVFYTTMQTVINSHPVNPTSPLELNPATISTNCNIRENGDTYCRTKYELYDGQDKLIAIIDVHSSGKIERSLNAGGLPATEDIKTGKKSGGNDLLLSED